MEKKVEVIVGPWISRKEPARHLIFSRVRQFNPQNGQQAVTENSRNTNGKRWWL
jgi:hypothetical protein